MAASNTYFITPTHKFLPSEITITNSIGSNYSDSMFEFDESDVWNVAISPEVRKPVPNPRISKRSTSAKKRQIGGTPASLPVSVPDWSKILKEDCTENRRRDSDDDDFDEDYSSGDGEDRIPPHEFLARMRTASFSVHEGIGRKLKGRDLSRVRNAVLEKLGFED
ncbi:hypothetical protein QVD17_36447 [Tagetes erecta]|uniref:Senescence regulator n=1 Tax=Tagetes erecta TaxID=13708 RepID=A0AAD8JWE8_TARER|nr:hypothetical protein QVD17_36447 [Tagetes erecta]